MTAPSSCSPDIVQRLRNFCVWNNRQSHYEPVPVCAEAADEILRLRATQPAAPAEGEVPTRAELLEAFQVLQGHSGNTTSYKICSAMIDRLATKPAALREVVQAQAEVELAKIQPATPSHIAQPSEGEKDQSFVDMLWKWFEDRGCDLRAERREGLTADDFRIMLDEHEAALSPSSAVGIKSGQPCPPRRALTIPCPERQP
jgi:hypothetical protein